MRVHVFEELSTIIGINTSMSTSICIIVSIYCALKCIDKGFPGGSDGKESACNAGDPVDNPLEKGMATHSSILAWRILYIGNLAGYSLWHHKESDMTE